MGTFDGLAASTLHVKQFCPQQGQIISRFSNICFAVGPAKPLLALLSPGGGVEAARRPTRSNPASSMWDRVYLIRPPLQASCLGMQTPS